MNGATLKNSILNLAIRGKLVEQRAEEGNAQDILNKIKVDKQNKIKNGELKKVIPQTTRDFNEDDFLFEIPSSWVWVTLGEIALNYDGKRKPLSVNVREKLKKNYDYYGATGTIDKVESYIFDGYYLLIGEDGGNFFTERDNAFTIRGKFWANNHVHVLGFFNDVLTDYICAYINALNLPALGLINGIAVPKLNQANMNSILVALPPLEEQKRIIAKIEELKPYVDKYDKAYSEVEWLNKRFPEDMQKSILQYAIQGKLVDQLEEDGKAEELYKQILEEKKNLIKEGKIKESKALPEITEDEIPFDIPENWKWVRLGDITHNWGQKKPDKLFDYIDVGSIDNIKGTLGKGMNLIEPKDAPSRARKVVKEGSVLYSTVRPYLLNICIIDKEFEHEPIASTAFAVLHPIDGVDNKYLYYVLKSPMFVSYVSSVMIGVAYPAINDTKLLAGLIPLPPFTEQKRIVEKLEKLLPYTKQMIL